MSEEAKSGKRLKVVVVGAAGVGKSALVNQWMELAPGVHYKPTPGVRECEVKKTFMKEHDAYLVFHDVRSDVVQDRDRAAAVLTDADAVVLVYSCQRLQETIAELRETWVPLLKSLTPHVFKVLVSTGNRKAAMNDYTRWYAPEEKDLYKEFPDTLSDIVHCFRGGYEAKEEAALQIVFKYARWGPLLKEILSTPTSSSGETVSSALTSDQSKRQESGGCRVL